MKLVLLMNLKLLTIIVIIPRHTIVVGYYGFTLDVRVSFCPSVRPSVRFPFPDDKHRRIFTKFGMCIDIVEIWFGIANGHISSKFELSARMEGYYSLKFLFPSC